LGAVSEGLNSVETHEKHRCMAVGEQFQKDLIVWKHNKRH